MPSSYYTPCKELEGVGLQQDLEKSLYWYKQAALQEHDLAINKCKALHIL